MHHPGPPLTAAGGGLTSQYVRNVWPATEESFVPSWKYLGEYWDMMASIHGRAGAMSAP
jgi:hypothetical protein